MARSSEKGFISGVVMALPVVVGYIAIGIPFGIIASKVGIPAWAVALQSIFVFAGSAQFASVQLLGMSAGLLPIVIATFVLNLRHFLMAMSLGSSLPKISLSSVVYLSSSITDETFGVNMTKLSGEKTIAPASAFGTNITAHFAWVFSTTLGALIGGMVPVEQKYTAGVLPLMFAVLIALQLKNGFQYVLAILAAAITVGFTFIIPGMWPFLITAVTVPTFATIYTMRVK